VKIHRQPSRVAHKAGVIQDLQQIAAEPRDYVKAPPSEGYRWNAPACIVGNQLWLRSKKATSDG
jgi:hypothetical protein